MKHPVGESDRFFVRTLPVDPCLRSPYSLQTPLAARSRSGTGGASERDTAATPSLGRPCRAQLRARTFCLIVLLSHVGVQLAVARSRDVSLLAALHGLDLMKFRSRGCCVIGERGRVDRLVQPDSALSSLGFFPGQTSLSERSLIGSFPRRAEINRGGCAWQSGPPPGRSSGKPSSGVKEWDLARPSRSLAGALAGLCTLPSAPVVTCYHSQLLV